MTGRYEIWSFLHILSSLLVSVIDDGCLWGVVKGPDSSL